jgi:gliding motility-associated-like protein
VVPNVITSNNDATNDYLVIKNWEDYDQVSIQIFNRWGNLIYENENYQNDWNGTDLNGKTIDEGVYFYMVTPKSEKYEYDNLQKTLYTLHGFVHVVRH